MQRRCFHSMNRITLCILVISTVYVAPLSALKTASAADPTAVQGGVIADTYGTIDEVTLHYDHGLNLSLAPLYFDLFTSLGPDVHVKVLCANEEEAAYFVDSWGDFITAPGRTLELINTGEPLTIWARDRLIARESFDLTTELDGFVPVEYSYYEPAKFNEIDTNFLMADDGLDPPVLNTYFHIEGGNVVSNRRYVFIGANVIEENPDVCWEGGEALRHLEDIMGRTVIPVRSEGHLVPWPHLDMYLTPIDDQLLLVADMNLAAHLLDREMSTEEAIEELGDFPVSSDSLIPDILDGIADRLRAQGFRVLRLPAIVDNADDWMLTYNNVLMEQRGSERRVFVPHYGLPVLDDAAVATYKDLGFEVSTVDVSHIYQLGGAVRCVTNVTRRRPVDQKMPHLTLPGKILYYDIFDDAAASEPTGPPLEDHWNLDDVERARTRAARPFHATNR